MVTYIAGSGAIGCRFGYSLAKNGKDVVLLDNWDVHIKAIQENGLKIVGDVEDTIQIPIMYPTEATREADLIILFTKSMQLENMLQEITHLIGEGTKVMCLLNGLGHEDIIRKYVPEKNIIIGVTIWTAGLAGPGTAILKGKGSVNIQSLDESGVEKAKEIVQLLNESGLNATYDENVFPSIWRKACVNGASNATCALLDCTVGEFFGSENGFNIARAITHEFVQVGLASGIALDEAEIMAYVEEASIKAAHHYPSMHQDLVKNHRPTEVDYINGVIARKGPQLGIKTPYCQMITDLVHAKEAVLAIR
ncbi:2-dehydropantoate 2-reductase [Granulicatella balaenopterae]|uniref:2-dehydropantoate 2-reductase n=1 Tax=Granulicatella balaenopterae TaxID=137733 RepID=A0A1H9HEL6_9LACT|nr:2-dehydropantoate 2-reductase [Granulicatella balaenopterae]SEQ60833.1 2-dehydropantoate 2-reductase [Granulicatella balaenopterae]